MYVNVCSLGFTWCILACGPTCFQQNFGFEDLVGESGFEVIILLNC